MFRVYENPNIICGFRCCSNPACVSLAVAGEKELFRRKISYSPERSPLAGRGKTKFIPLQPPLLALMRRCSHHKTQLANLPRRPPSSKPPSPWHPPLRRSYGKMEEGGALGGDLVRSGCVAPKLGLRELCCTNSLDPSWDLFC